MARYRLAKILRHCNQNIETRVKGTRVSAKEAATSLVLMKIVCVFVCRVSFQSHIINSVRDNPPHKIWRYNTFRLHIILAVD